MTNKKTLIIKQLAVFLCGIVLSTAEVTQPQSAIPETAGVLEPGCNFPFAVYPVSGDPVSVVLPQEEATVGALKCKLGEEFQHPEEFITILGEGRILRDAELVRYSDTTPLTFVLNGSKVEIQIIIDAGNHYHYEIYRILKNLNQQIWDDFKDDVSRLAELTPQRREELENIIRNTRITAYQHDHRYCVLQLERILRSKEGPSGGPISKIIGDLPPHLQTGELSDEFAQKFFEQYCLWFFLKEGKDVEVPVFDHARNKVDVLFVSKIRCVMLGDDVTFTYMAIMN